MNKPKFPKIIPRGRGNESTAKKIRDSYIKNIPANSVLYAIILNNFELLTEQTPIEFNRNLLDLIWYEFLIYNGESAGRLAMLKKDDEDEDAKEENADPKDTTSKVKNERRWRLKETTEKRKYHSVEVLPYLVVNSIIIDEPVKIRRKDEQIEHELLMKELIFVSI